jgi:hypothetical protein
MTDLPIIFASFVIDLSAGVSTLRADRSGGPTDLSPEAGSQPFRRSSTDAVQS